MEIFLFLIGLLFGGIFASDIRKRLLSVHSKYFNAKNPLEGIYSTIWDKGDNRPQREFIELKATSGSKEKFLTKVIYSIDEESHYEVTGRVINDSELLGEWANVNKKLHGALHLIGEPTDEFVGVWTGSSSGKEVKSGKFTLIKRDLEEKKLPDLELIFDRFSASLVRLIKNHEENSEGSSPYKVNIDTPLRNSRMNNISLYINEGVFNPTLGSVSNELLKYTSKFNPSSVADIGCGCGYYSLAFGLTGAKVVGVDISARAYECSIRNINEHGLQNDIDVIKGSLYIPIYKKFKFSRKFDLIVANMPFTSLKNFESSTKELSKEIKLYAEYKEMFAAKENSLLELILGAEYFLEKNGHLVFVIGGSASMNEVDKSLVISSMKIVNIQPIDLPGEDARIVDLTL